MEQALKPEEQAKIDAREVSKKHRASIDAKVRAVLSTGEAQGNVAVEPVAISLSDPLVILAGIKQFGLAADGSDLRDLEASIASLSERLAAVITRLWPNGFGPKNLEELAVFIEEERRCDTEYRDELRAKLAEAREIIDPFAAYIKARDEDYADIPDPTAAISYAPSFRGPVVHVTFGDFRRARAFRDATSGAKS